jgi:hypothetical protein
MTRRSKLLALAGVAAAAAAAAWALGVPAGTLLVVGAALLCPAAMFFGMGAAGHAHGGHCAHGGAAPKEAGSGPRPDARREGEAARV